MIEGLRPYPEMVKPEPDWLPALPVHWELHRAKANFREVDERSVSGDEELLSVSHKTGVTPRSQKNVTMFMAESYEGHKTCQPGDIVVNTLWAWMAALGASKHVGIVSPAYGVYRQRAEAFDARFLDYLLRTETYRGEYLRSSRGITTSRLRLYPPDFLNISFVQPPLEEQRLIVRFLDWHGAMTGRLIRAKKGLIGLLNEQKQSIIHRAVTRGLDPNAKLKPSGVDWLGDVPAHWSIQAIKRLARLQSGEGITAFQIEESGPYPVYGGNGLRGYASRYTHDGEYVLIGRQGALCGNVHLVTSQIFASEHAIVAHPRAQFVSRWFAETLRVMNLNQYSIAAAQPGLSVERIEVLKMPVPPVAEQAKLVDLIERETSGLEEVMARVQSEIALIQEFRVRLIADVATGQLDVRAAAASLPDVAEGEAFADTSDDTEDESEVALDVETEDA